MAKLTVLSAFSIVFYLAVVSSVNSEVEIDRCTTIAAAAGAGIDGPMATHTSDCSSCDFRINKVPARDWPAGSKRPLYVYRGEYPATVSSERGETWNPRNLEGNADQLAAWGKESIITGYIPQVEHTFALIEGGYGIMNEHQVAIGESTCAAKIWSAPTIAGGKAMIEVREMSRIALERCRSAREAVELMGSLAVSYGFYAADWSGGDVSKAEGGEALTVVDKNEAWVFHVLGDDTGSSAVWAAQRVPYGHVTAVANQFIIRHVDPYNPDFLFSKNMWEVAERQGWWSPANGLLDFLATFAPKRIHSTYCTRRVWRIFSLVAPSIALPADTDPLGSDYPFSVPVDRALSPKDLMRVQRDHYEGTPFDLTKGIAAGPYGDPNRFDSSPQPADNLTRADVIKGSYERAVSLFRTSTSIVAVGRPRVPDALALVWLTQYAPSSSSYTPLYVAATRLPPSHSKGSLFKYDNEVAFWNFLAVGNYASRFYKYAMSEVTERILVLEDESFAAVAALEKKILEDPRIYYATDEFKTALTQFTVDWAAHITRTWRELLFVIITRYHDGYVALDLDQPTINMKKLFYPKYWLDATGYFNAQIVTGADVILFSTDESGKTVVTVPGLVAVVAMTASLCFLLNWYMSRKSIFTNAFEGWWKVQGQGHEYRPINTTS